MSSPQVSIVLGVFNAGSDLLPALRSILDQPGVDFECICVDDGSTDSTPTLLDELALSDSRLRIITQPNRGLTQALIRGCSEAKGEFIARQDSDDLTVGPRLKLQADKLAGDSSLAFVSCQTEYIGPRGEPLFVENRPTDKEEATARLRARQGGPVHGSVMFRRSSYELAGGYRSQLYYAQDHDLWYRMARIGYLTYLPETLYQYRVSPASISGRLHPLKLAFAAIVDELDGARERGLDESEILSRAAGLRRQPQRPGRSSQTSEAKTNYFIARCLLKQGDAKALHYLRQTLEEEPFNSRAWASLPKAALLRLFG